MSNHDPEFPVAVLIMKIDSDDTSEFDHRGYYHVGRYWGDGIVILSDMFFRTNEFSIEYVTNCANDLALKYGCQVIFINDFIYRWWEPRKIKKLLKEKYGI